MKKFLRFINLDNTIVSKDNLSLYACKIFFSECKRYIDYLIRSENVILILFTSCINLHFNQFKDKGESLNHKMCLKFAHEKAKQSLLYTMVSKLIKFNHLCYIMYK
jgi:hypothetical protein